MGGENAGERLAEREKRPSESFNRITYLGKTAVYALFVWRAVYRRLRRKKIFGFPAGRIRPLRLDWFLGRDLVAHQSLIRNIKR